MEQIRDRRAFLSFLACSLLACGFTLSGCSSTPQRRPSVGATGAEAQDVFDFETLAKQHLGYDAYAFAAGGADDEKTLRANREAFDRIQIRARRLVDVSTIETATEVLAQRMPFPIMLRPVGLQQVFHPEAEIPTARAAARTDTTMIASSVSNASVGEIAHAGGRPVWFQLYPTTDRRITKFIVSNHGGRQETSLRDIRPAHVQWTRQPTHMK